MYYKNGDHLGLRRLFAKKDTAFSFGGRRAGLGEVKLRGLADEVMKMLDDGKTEKVAKKWAVKKVNEMDAFG